MNSPLISVIVPSYNQGDFIENTILSVIGQSYANWELIIQDGNSKDNTKTICKKYALSDSRITFISEPDNGFADAVNKAITKCKGTFCAIQSSDDFYSNASVFQDVAELYNQHPELKIITGSCQHISSDLCYTKIKPIKPGI